MSAAHPLAIEASEPDAEELDVLVDRFAHRVPFFARRVEVKFGLDAQWRDDLISSGYWGLLKALKNRRADAHARELSAYVSRRVEGAVIDEARRVLTRASNESDCDAGSLDTDPSSLGADVDWQASSVLNPENAADRSGRWRSIEASIGHLTPDHRALLMAYAEGRSLSEIARESGTSSTRLQNQMLRISRQIRAQSPELRRLLRHEI